MERDDPEDHRRAAPSRRRRRARRTCSSCMLTGVDKKTGQKLDRREHRRPVHDLPRSRGTRPPAACCRSPSTLPAATTPRSLERAYAEVDRVLGTDISVLPSYAAGAGPAPTSPRSSTRPCGCGRPRPRSPATRTRTPCSAASTGSPRAPRSPALTPDAAPRQRGLGRRTPRSSTPTTSGPRPRPVVAAQRLQAVRLGPAGLHRPPVRHAGGRAGAGHAPAALRARSTTSTTS